MSLHSYPSMKRHFLKLFPALQLIQRTRLGIRNLLSQLWLTGYVFSQGEPYNCSFPVSGWCELHRPHKLEIHGHWFLFRQVLSSELTSDLDVLSALKEPTVLMGEANVGTTWGKCGKCHTGSQDACNEWERTSRKTWKRWLTLRKSGNYWAKERGGWDSTSHLISITILQVSYYFPFTNLKTKVLGC